MAGYADDFSMSNNAIDAYDRGLRPRSKSGLRKRADGTNIRVDETYKRAPRGTTQIFQEIERRMNGGGANGAKAGAQPVDDYYANKDIVYKPE